MKPARHVHQRAGRPADVVDFVAIETPWKATPPYAPPESTCTGRGHVVDQVGRCKACGMQLGPGGWDVVCPGKVPRLRRAV